MQEVTMPQLGEAVAEATIDRWLKKKGDRVQRFEPLLEVLTEKVNTEIPCPVTGVLVEIVAAEGTTVKVGEAIARFEVEAAPAKSPAPAQPPTPGGLFPSAPAISLPKAPPAPQKADEAAAPLSPAVRRLAAEYGIDPRTLQGTGHGGRVTREDVVHAANAQRQAAAPPEKTEPDSELIAPSALRKAIADRMVESTRNIPHAWMMVEADVTGLVRLRQSVKSDFTRREGFDLTYFPFFVKAVVEGLRQQPSLNASWTESGILYRHQIHLGIAVAAEDGLVVPVLRAADGMSVAGIARVVHDLSGRARSGDLLPDEMRGGTFTVNNTGALGSVISVPIINPPQSGIITLETIAARPAVVGEGIAIRHLVNLSFSFDHRIADGLVAGRFMKAVRTVMESFQPGDPIY